MKKILLWAVAVLIATTFTQCGNKAQQSAEVSVEETESNVTGDENVMVYGICGEASAMNTLQLITDTGDTLNLSIENAKEENQVFGGYSVGDKMAVYMKKDSEQPLMVVNETTLMGNWIMPNPIDGSSTLGIMIKDGGIAESINQPTIIYKTWRIALIYGKNDKSLGDKKKSSEGKINIKETRIEHEHSITEWWFR